MTAPSNPGLTVSGSIALLGECWDSNGNKLPDSSILVSVINGCIATISITQTNLAGTPGAVAFAGVAPTVSVS